MHCNCSNLHRTLEVHHLPLLLSLSVSLYRCVVVVLSWLCGRGRGRGRGLLCRGRSLSSLVGVVALFPKALDPSDMELLTLVFAF